MEKKHLVVLIFFLLFGFVRGQNNHLYIQVTVDSVNQTLKIYQKLNYYNNTQRELFQLYFHDWNHAYSDKNSNLGKRFIENYNKKFYFTSVKNRGYTKIDSIRSNGENLIWKREKNAIDQLSISFNQPIPQESYTGIEFWYTLKIPHKKFTGYGYDKDGYYLKNWLIVPAVYDQGWQVMSNLDMNDQYLEPTDFEVIIKIPSQFELHSNLNVHLLSPEIYQLNGNSMMDFELILNRSHTFQTFQFDTLQVDTDLNKIVINPELKHKLVKRQIDFLKENLGFYPHSKILITQTQYDKNPIYGFNQLPGILRPFPDSFEWDIRMFQTLTKEYIDQSIFSNTRKNAWLREGLPHYLMMKYLETYYPNERLIGNISKIWGIKTYYISKMNYSDRYLLGYQYVARKNLDQSLVTSTDSLTNYNRSVANPFKTALGLKYLEEYTDYETVKQSIRNYFTANTLQKSSEKEVFKNSLYILSRKKLDWFFNEYVQTDTDFDFVIRNLQKTNDSIEFTINNEHTKLPIPVYGIRQNELTGIHWLEKRDSLPNYTITNQNEKRVMINYKGIIPETNLKNNWKNIENKMLGKPLSIRWLSDAEDPYHSQIFVEPNFYYNYYDGFTFANIFSNRTILKQKLEYRIAPSYGFKSNSLSGSFWINYTKYFNDSKLNSFNSGISGNYFHYKPSLTYTALSTYGQLIFKRKNLRTVDSKALTASYTMVQKDIDQTDPSLQEHQYGVLNLNFLYSNPALINSFHFNTDLEFSSKFSKFYTELAFRRLINNNQQFGVRLFLGTFIHNNSKSDFFSYGINRPYDYLFRYNYFGRFESTGLLSQQYILNDGGFISEMPVQFSNQWLASINTSIGLWKWFELYNNVGLTKSTGQNAYFLHDKGIRFNFISGMLEVYFPLHSNNGWEISNSNYVERIRFVLTAQPREIIKYLKRGVM